MTKPLFTVTLSTGQEAVAKRHPWLGIQPLTYANYAQAKAMQAILGVSWRLWGTKPAIYVVKIKGRKQR